jgi:uncharacterized membrane protein
MSGYTFIAGVMAALLIVMGCDLIMPVGQGLGGILAVAGTALMIAFFGMIEGA